LREQYYQGNITNREGIRSKRILTLKIIQSAYTSVVKVPFLSQAVYRWFFCLSVLLIITPEGKLLSNQSWFQMTENQSMD
jgi:hypothetical protein